MLPAAVIDAADGLSTLPAAFDPFVLGHMFIQPGERVEATAAERAV